MRPDVIHITDIMPGDYFYMCSDGMLEQMTNDELLALFSSEVTDDEKCQQLKDATAHNQDNHSAWLIHIKDVVKEEDEEKIENEEPISRCNALNIIPEVIDTNKDDVVIVKEEKKAKTLLQKIKDVLLSL